MKKIRQLLALFLAVILAMGLFTMSASAADTTQTTKAKALWSLGLFKGYDDSGSNFGLSDKATREQALVFLIRLLGEDKAASAWTGATPYSDVSASSWVKPYIGYAKEKGYTVGIGDGKFGTGNNASMQEMTTFVLRGLGYSDSSAVGDFTWNNCVTVAKQKGILDSEKIITPFTRGVAVDILFGTIGTNIKNQNYSLVEKLADMGVVTEAQCNEFLKIVEGETTATEKSDLAAGTYTMKCQSKYLRVNSGKLEIRDTTPAHKFTVASSGNYSTIMTEDGKYLSLTSMAGSTQLTTSTSAFQWLIQKQSGGAYTIRPVSDTRMVVNANGKSSANGTKMIISQSSGTPSNALITVSTETNEKTKAAFKVTNNTGKSIKELYIASALYPEYKTEYISSKKLSSLSNGKYVSINFNFDTNSLFDFYIRYADGTEAEAVGLSFAKATSVGGSIKFTASKVSLYVGTSKTAASSAALKVQIDELTEATAKLTSRYNTSVTRYNALLAECEKQGLTDDAEFVTVINNLTDAVNSIGTTLNGTTKLTAVQVTGCTKALDELDGFINELDALLKTETAVTEKTVTIYNMTGKTWTGLYSSSVLVDNWGENLSSGSVTDNSSLKVIFPVTADEYKFDLKAVCSNEEYLFEGLDMSKVSSGATLYLYLDGTTPTISSTKPEISATGPDASTTERIVTMTIVNSTGKTFTEIYSTSNMDTSWGTTDLLAGDDFGEISLEFPITSDITKYDLKFVETPEISHIISNLDFSAASGKVTVELTWNGSNVICTQIG